MNNFTKSSILILYVLAFLGPRLYASNSAGFDVITGKGTSGFELNGNLDLKPANVTNPFEAFVNYAHQETTLGTNDKTNQYTAGVSHVVDDQWAWQTQATYWKDDINSIHYEVLK